MSDIQMPGVRHDTEHSLRVDRTAIPGERVKRWFWCTCGKRFGLQSDVGARNLYREHRKINEKKKDQS